MRDTILKFELHQMISIQKLLLKLTIEALEKAMMIAYT